MTTMCRAFSVAVGVLLLILPAGVLAQTGEITGTVTDADTDEALPGANVVLQESSIGAATDVNGNYTIQNVPVGTHTVVASYVGYDTERQEVQVEAGEEVRLNIEMSWTGVEGEEVVITEQAQGQNQAINEQISARTIKNVVSSEKIRELPDESAATAVSRLPGVSLQNGDQIVVRGMEAKYNTVSVNGIQLPSTTTSSRSTELGFVSSNMLSGIEVSKTVTPAMDANSIGGNVNLRLKEADEGLHYDAMVQGDYNTQDHTYDNYRAWASISNRFFDDKLGVFLQGNARRFNGGGDVASASWLTLPNAGDVAGREPYGLEYYDLSDQININDEYGASLLLDYRLPNNAGKIVLQNAYSSERYDNVTLTDRLLLQTGNREFRVNRTLGDRYLLVNSLQGEHALGDLSIDWAASHSRSQQEDDLGYQIDFDGTNYFEGQPLDRWTSEDQVFDIEYQEGNPGTADEGQTQYQDFSERRLAGTLDLTLPVTFGAISGQFQGGGKFTNLSRENDYTNYYKRLADEGVNDSAAVFLESIGADPRSALDVGVFADSSYADGRGQYYLGGRRTFRGALNIDYLDTYFRQAQRGWPLSALANSNEDDYVAEEQVAAGYLMGDFNIGDYVSVLGGVRYENYSFDNKAPYVNQTNYDGTGAVLDTLRAERSYGQFFPNIQLQITPTDWFDVRLAYTKTTSRPDYQRLLPNTLIWADESEAGNPNLKPTISDNFDAYFSVYSNRVGLFTVGVFMKNLSNVVRQISVLRSTIDQYEGVFWAPIDAGYTECEDGDKRVSCPDGSIVADVGSANPVTTYVNNPDDGRITGFEVDWQTNFWYLPRPLNSLVLNVNYTRMNSEIDWQSVFRVQQGPFDPIEQVDTTRTGRLYQQAEDIFNATLGADIGGFSGRISFRYQGEVLADLATQNPANDAFTQPVTSLDVSLRQRLPIEGLSLFFNGVNLTHPAQYNSRNLVKGSADAEPSDSYTRIAYYPRRLQLGVRYGL